VINSGQCKERHRHKNSKACLGEGRQAGSAGRGSTNKGHRAAEGLFGGRRSFSSTRAILPVVIFFHLFLPRPGSCLPEGMRGESSGRRRAGRAARLPQRGVEEPRPEASTAASPRQNQELPPLPAPGHGNISWGEKTPAIRHFTGSFYEIGKEQ